MAVEVGVKDRELDWERVKEGVGVGVLEGMERVPE